MSLSLYIPSRLFTHIIYRYIKRNNYKLLSSFIIILTFCLQKFSYCQNSPKFFSKLSKRFFQNSSTRFIQNSHFVRASTATSDMQTQHYFVLYNNTNLVSIQTRSLSFQCILPANLYVYNKRTDVAYLKENTVLLYTNRYYMLRISLV